MLNCAVFGGIVKRVKTAELLEIQQDPALVCGDDNHAAEYGMMVVSDYS